MMKLTFKAIIQLCGMLLTGIWMTSCSLMDTDWEDCPSGLYLSFKYDYNLEQTDFFHAQVGSVTVYVFDENNRLVLQQEESNTPGHEPLKLPQYAMHLELKPGAYKLVVLAGQRSYDEMLSGQQAKFIRSEMNIGDPMQNLEVQLNSQATSEGLQVPNAGLPLDTLWHGIELNDIQVYSTHATYDTISLIRNTKHLNVTLRQLDETVPIDITDYDMKIQDRNTHLLWDNTWNEQETVAYVPYQTWNSDDRPSVDTRSSEAAGEGLMAHADFMTSRICYHQHGGDDAVFSVRDKATGKEQVQINLPDMLTRLSTHVLSSRYSPQEFLDRCSDYHLTFFLNGSTWEYVEVTVGALSWSVRIQQIDL